MEDRWILIKHTTGEDLIHINSLIRITKVSSTEITLYASDISCGITFTFLNVDETNMVLKSIDDRFNV